MKPPGQGNIVVFRPAVPGRSIRPKPEPGSQPGMERCGDDRYQRAVKEKRQLLGRGGCCTGVEKWVEMQSGDTFAAKHVVKPKMAQREIEALTQAKAVQVPRVPELKECFAYSSRDQHLVLEYVDGESVSMYLKYRADNKFGQPHAEAQMLTAAAQLFETLSALHQGAEFAHLDISASNIMLTSNQHAEWDRMRLIDYGMAKPGSPDAEVMDIHPSGTTISFAAPEVLHSLAVAGKTGEKLCKVNGPAADMWSAGCVLYAMLTGDYPCNMGFSDCVFTQQWVKYAEAQDQQKVWADGVKHADAQGIPMKGNLLYEVVLHSTTPAAAQSFFTAVLHPDPVQRLTSSQALEHPFLKGCVHQMQTSQSAAKGAAPAQRAQRAEMHGMVHKISQAAKSYSPLGLFSSQPKKQPCKWAGYFPAYRHPASDEELQMALAGLESAGSCGFSAAVADGQTQDKQLQEAVAMSQAQDQQLQEAVADSQTKNKQLQDAVADGQIEAKQLHEAVLPVTSKPPLEAETLCTAKPVAAPNVYNFPAAPVSQSLQHKSAAAVAAVTESSLASPALVSQPPGGSVAVHECSASAPAVKSDGQLPDLSSSCADGQSAGHSLAAACEQALVSHDSANTLPAGFQGKSQTTAFSNAVAHSTADSCSEAVADVTHADADVAAVNRDVQKPCDYPVADAAITNSMTAAQKALSSHPLHFLPLDNEGFLLTEPQDAPQDQVPMPMLEGGKLAQRGDVPCHPISDISDDDGDDDDVEDNGSLLDGGGEVRSTAAPTSTSRAAEAATAASAGSTTSAAAITSALGSAATAANPPAAAAAMTGGREQVTSAAASTAADTSPISGLPATAAAPTAAALALPATATAPPTTPAAPDTTAVGLDAHVTILAEEAAKNTDQDSHVVVSPFDSMDTGLTLGCFPPDRYMAMDNGESRWQERLASGLPRAVAGLSGAAAGFPRAVAGLAGIGAIAGLCLAFAPRS